MGLKNPLTVGQEDALVMIERVCSSLSLIGCSFIIVTFLTSRAFHKPINRLVFYASIGNIMTNVGTLIGRAALGNINGILCQFQSFLIQMFMAADAYWTLAMACNVYLTFYHKYDAELLRTMEKWYFLACYGAPFLPAFIFIWVTKPDGSRPYGNATLWCWIASEWDIWRIGAFYGPVWLAIAVTFLIYIRAGGEIYKKRKQLRDFSSIAVPEPSPVMNGAFGSTKTTEVHVTSEAIEDTEVPLDLSRLGRRPIPVDQPLYSVTVSSVNPTDRRISYPPEALQYLPQSELPTRRYAAMEQNNAAWGYTKVAVLFFTAMLVTWIPSSANRVYTVVHPDEISVPLIFMSAFVLPLQGFWNAVIYITTSLRACRIYFGDIFASTSASRSVPTVPFSGGFAAGFGSAKGTRLESRAGRGSETESTTELASRPSTKEGSPRF